MAKKAKDKAPFDEIKVTKKNLEPEVVTKRPAQTYTEILAEPKEKFLDEVVVKPKPIDEAVGVITEFIKGDFRPDKTEPIKVKVAEPKPPSPLDFLRFPLGALDFDNAGILFKNPDAPNNKKAIAQFTLLLNLGYKATLRIVDNNYAYFQFDKA